MYKWQSVNMCMIMQSARTQLFHLLDCYRRSLAQTGYSLFTAMNKKKY